TQATADRPPGLVPPPAGLVQPPAGLVPPHEHPRRGDAAASARPVERRRLAHQLDYLYLHPGLRLDQLPGHRLAAIAASPVERQWFRHASSFRTSIGSSASQAPGSRTWPTTRKL